MGISALVFTLPVELWKRSTLKQRDTSPSSRSPPGSDVPHWRKQSKAGSIPAASASWLWPVPGRNQGSEMAEAQPSASTAKLPPKGSSSPLSCLAA